MNEKILELKDVEYIENDTHVLSDISFSLMKGENLVIFGPENSGIERLVKIILGLNNKYTGEMIYKGESVKDFDYIMKLDYKKELGYLHPDYGLLSNMNVEQNISLPLEYHSKLPEFEIKKIVDKMIYQLNLDYCKKFRPTNLTEAEILKTAYARAVILEPDMLVFEHALEGQSPLNVETFMQDLKARADLPDKLIIFITYEPEKFIDFSDKFIMMFNGKIVFSGDRDDFNMSDNPYLIQYKNRDLNGPMAIL